MKYLLDTNVVSETIRTQPDASVMAWLAVTDRENLYLSVITLGELERGIIKHHDPVRQARLRHWYTTTVLPDYAGRILDITPPVMSEWARLVQAARSAGQPPGTLDALIAATASAHGLIIVTRNTKHFDVLGVSTFNPWQEEPEKG